MENDVLVAVLNAADGDMTTELWTRLRGWLQPEEAARADGYKDMEARASFLIGRGMARAMLAEVTGVAPTHWQFAEGPHGRPEIASPDSPWRFNIAHSHGVVACAVAYGRDIGVDVEFMNRKASTHDVAARACSPEELADINAVPEAERQERFLVYWTLKEAYLKARGLGISVHMADVAFSIQSGEPTFTPRGALLGADRDWLFRLAQPAEHYLVSVAVSTADGVSPNIRFQRFGSNRFPVS